MGRRGRIPNNRVALLAFALLVLASCTDLTTQNRLVMNRDTATVSAKNGRYYLNEKPFTGQLYQLNEWGDTVFLGLYRNGKEHGIQKTWYAKGRLREVRLFNKGEKEGRHTGYWENGNKRFDYLFEQDLWSGVQHEWHANGRLFKQSQYRAGYEQGLQRIWDTDGTLLANYEARKGRNYGNIGRKNCQSVWQNDSIRMVAQ